MEPLVVCSHLPGEGHFRSARFSVRSVTCDHEFAYWAGLAAAWSHPGPIVLVEHDMEVTDEHVGMLLACPDSLVTFAYRCHWASTGLARSIFAQRVAGRPMRPRERWADRSGIGLCKVGPDARRGVLRREPWPRVELAVEAAVRGPWRVLWPEVAHHHW